MNPVHTQQTAHHEALGSTAQVSGVEQFFSQIAAIYDALRVRASVAARIDARAPQVAGDLLRRARRRHAAFDLFLREALPAHADDLALAVRAQQGSAESVLEVRRRLEPVVLKRIYGYNLGWNEEELVDLVFDRVTQKLPTYRGQASLRTWAGILAANALKNWMRSEDSKPKLVPIDGAVMGSLTQLDGPDADVLGDERDRGLKRLASQLSEIAQEVLSASEWDLLQRLIIDDQSYQSLSNQMGKTTGALRKRRFDALRKLQGAVSAKLGQNFPEMVRETLENG